MRARLTVNIDFGESGMRIIPTTRYALPVLLTFATLSASAATVRYSYYGADASTYTATYSIFPNNGEDPSPIPVPGDYRITGWVEVDGPLAANLINADISNSISDWSFDLNFSTGSINHTNYQSLLDYYAMDVCNGSGCFNVTVSTDAQGNISEWSFKIPDLQFFGNGESYNSRFSLTPTLPNGDNGKYSESIWLGGGYVSVKDYTSASVGSWSATVVPIPGAVWLFASALGLMGWRSRRH